MSGYVSGEEDLASPATSVAHRTYYVALNGLKANALLRAAQAVLDFRDTFHAMDEVQAAQFEVAEQWWDVCDALKAAVKQCTTSETST